jgi:gamma-glutamyltranspeptidase/glutathione hydrolase
MFRFSKIPKKRMLLTALTAVLFVGAAATTDLSPAKWSPAERAELERLEELAKPEANRIVESADGLVAGTMSPVAVRVGMDVLSQDGTAADAAAAIALTQVTRALGSFVSYAGITQILYFEARTGKVYSLDAGWASYVQETSPQTIPGSESLNGEQGRKTLVPGFMAGIEAMQQRFGVLPFGELFAPAIWYAENGVRVSGSLAGFFKMREKLLSRTEGGRQFLRQGTGRTPSTGDKFLQLATARMLRGVAEQGAQYMYSGAWGQHYVEAVRREGGKITLDDMARYRPIWQEPLSTTFAGNVVFGPGRNSEGGFQALEALNLIEELKIEQAPPYWQSAESFQWLSRVLNITDLPAPWMLDRAQAKGVTLALGDRATKPFAAALAPLVEGFFKRAKTAGAPAHTAGIVVVDRHGNVAALVHSINSVLWGTTGIVVDGVPVSDPAAISQATLAEIRPGDRLPDLMVPLIATRDGKPMLAVAITGSVQRESVRIVLGLLGYKTDLATLMAAPPLITRNGTRRVEFLLPEQAYPADFPARLRALGSTLEMVPEKQVKDLRGVGVFTLFNQESNHWSSIETTDLFSFSSAL